MAAEVKLGKALRLFSFQALFLSYTLLLKTHGVLTFRGATPDQD